MSDETTKQMDPSDFYNNVNESASVLANAFSQKIHSDISQSETSEEKGTSFMVDERQLLALAITLDTSIRVLQTDLINVLTNIATAGNSSGSALATAMNFDLITSFNEKADAFNLHYGALKD